MSAHPAAGRRGLIAALVAQVADYVLEPIEDTVAAEPLDLEPHPVIALVSAARRSGASTVARLLAAELAARAEGAAVVMTGAAGRPGPRSRAAIRLTTALTGVADARASGRLCLASAAEPQALVKAARYLAPVVLDLPPDGSAAAIARHADRIAVVASGGQEPALLDAVAAVLGGSSLKVANRVVDAARWERADLRIPEARLPARCAALGTRTLGPLAAAIAELADALEGPA